MSLRKDANGKDLEIKSFAFKVEECKQLKNDPTTGVIRGYASTFGNIDRGDDIVARGAFDRTIMEHRRRGNRPIRLFANHRSDAIMGGLPIQSVKVDDVGLFVEAHLDLNVAKASEFFSLAGKGFISDFSIGFSTRKADFDEENNIRTLLDIELFEVSLVNEPMNQQAVVVEIEIGPDDDDDDDDDKGKKPRVPGYRQKPKRGKGMSNSTSKKGEAASTDGLVIFTNEKGERVGIDEDGNAVAVPQQEKTFTVKDVESLQSNAEVEEQLKQAGYSKEARKTLISKIRKGFESDGRDDQDDGDNRDDESANRRDAENAVKGVISSLSDLSTLFKPTEPEDEKDG